MSEGVPVSATDELRERLAKALHEAQCGCPTWVVKDLEDTQYDDMAAALLPLVVAVVAEARTEGAIAELEYLSADTAKTLQVWTPSDLNERAAALRGVGNQRKFCVRGYLTRMPNRKGRRIEGLHLREHRAPEPSLPRGSCRGDRRCTD